MKKILVAACILLFSTATFAADRGYVLVANNVFAMTLTKLVVVDKEKECEETKANFEAIYPDKKRVAFECVKIGKK